ncbi:MAG: C40 family peptidase [Burkholderiaceae bacterium]|nr:C40 family peptidase [Burkholderiaceae bacterium]
MATPPPHRSAWRLARLSICALSAVILAGCAGGTHQASSDETHAFWANSYNDPYANYGSNEDPINRLLSQQRRPHSGGQGITAHAALVAEALRHRGIRYRFGGSSPEEGFDCSGLVSYAVSQALGLRLPRSAAEIANFGQTIGRSELVAGDLVFFNTMGRKYSHVGIYLGDDRFVHSPSAGGVVRIENLTMAYWNKRYNGARRLSAADLTAMR